jgi:hypothetical protein
MATLPAHVQEQGGALVSVLGWEQHQQLPDTVHDSLVDLIKQYPGLNTEDRVDCLADMASYYGESFDGTLTDFITEHGLDRVYSAIDLLHELGLRSASENDRVDLARMLGFLSACDQVQGLDVTSASLLERLIEELGGYKKAFTCAVDDIERVVEGWVSGERYLDEDERNEDDD